MRELPVARVTQETIGRICPSVVSLPEGGHVGHVGHASSAQQFLHSAPTHKRSTHKAYGDTLVSATAGPDHSERRWPPSALPQLPDKCIRPRDLPQTSRQSHSCNMSGSHGGDYQECRLLGYENPVRTSQETLHFHYRVRPVNAM
jgi:hypothetical protein